MSSVCRGILFAGSFRVGVDGLRGVDDAASAEDAAEGRRGISTAFHSLQGTRIGGGVEVGIQAAGCAVGFAQQERSGIPLPHGQDWPPLVVERRNRRTEWPMRSSGFWW